MTSLSLKGQAPYPHDDLPPCKVIFLAVKVNKYRKHNTFTLIRIIPVGQYCCSHYITDMNYISLACKCLPKHNDSGQN